MALEAAPEPLVAEAAAPARRTSIPIAVRLALMFALAAMVIFALAGAALHHVLSRELDHYLQEQLQGRMTDLRYMLEHSRSPQLADHVKEKMTGMQSADGRSRFWLWSDDPAYRFGPQAQWVAGRVSTRLTPLTLPGSAAPGDAEQVVVVGSLLGATSARPAVQLMVGMDAAGIAGTLRTFRAALIALTLLATAVVAALGYWIAMLGLRPVQQLSADTQRIGRTHGQERLPLPVLPRELLALGASINAALDRLSATYQQLETFNADVAHELRTPVSNLIGQTQVALSRDRTAGELREVLQSNLEELERLRSMVADMLFLARAEQGERAQDPVEVSLAAEMGKIVEFFDMLLDDAGLHVQLHGDARATVQRPLLRRALSNLLHNAIQHGSGGQQIDVEIGSSPGGGVQLSMRNASAPVAPAQMAHLFDRFYRLDSARANSGESHGLGLAIVKAIATMHGGEVAAEQADGHMTMTIRLPAAVGPQTAR